MQVWLPVPGLLPIYAALEGRLDVLGTLGGASDAPAYPLRDTTPQVANAQVAAPL